MDAFAGKNNSFVNKAMNNSINTYNNDKLINKKSLINVNFSIINVHELS